MFTSLNLSSGPVEDFLLLLFNNPQLFLLCVAVLIALIIGGYGAYSLLMRSTSKRMVMSNTELYLSLLRKEAAREGEAHGQESAQGFLEEWEEKLEGKISGEEGIIRLQKFNMKVETFLKKRGLL